MLHWARSPSTEVGLYFDKTMETQMTTSLSPSVYGWNLALDHVLPKLPLRVQWRRNHPSLGEPEAPTPPLRGTCGIRKKS